ncbi:MAG TPA: DinB family protein [Candidatus Eisenbacteria bacterium]|nr:DinB family protein [Candidatus Eisenbacteria bacterium]
MNAQVHQIDAAWNQLSALVQRLGPGGLMAKAADGWAVKDHLAHIGAWEHSLLGLIGGQDRLAAMGVHETVEENTDAVNDAVFKLHQHETAEQALKYFRDSHVQLMAALGKLTDADLEQPYSHYQPSDPEEMRPVRGWVAGNTYEHYAEHIDWINQLLSESSAAR